MHFGSCPPKSFFGLRFLHSEQPFLALEQHTNDRTAYAPVIRHSNILFLSLEQPACSTHGARRDQYVRGESRAAYRRKSAIVHPEYRARTLHCKLLSTNQDRSRR